MKKIIALLALIALCFTGCVKKPDSVPNPPTHEMVFEL